MGSHTTVGRYRTGANGFGTLGLYRYDRHHLLVAVNGDVGNGDCNGVYLLDTSSGPGTGPCSGQRIPGTEAMGLPNAVAMDHAGRIYATDSSKGAVWRADSPAGPASIWLRDPRLAGTGALTGVPLGANGIDIAGATAYVAVTEGSRLVAIPIRRDGTAGPLRVVAESPALAGIDGVVVGPDRQFYAVVNSLNTLVRISRNGVVTVLATSADHLEYPGSLAFGPAPKGRHAHGEPQLYFTNLSIGELFGQPPVFGPSVMRIAVNTHH
jgi:hypothetical protein